MKSHTRHGQREGHGNGGSTDEEITKRVPEIPGQKFKSAGQVAREAVETIKQFDLEGRRRILKYAIEHKLVGPETKFEEIYEKLKENPSTKIVIEQIERREAEEKKQPDNRLFFY